MKPGRAIAINNDKNNPIRRLFDLSAPIFRARSLFWLITIFLDLGGEPNRALRARSNLSNRARRTILTIVISITNHFPSVRRIFFVVGPAMIWIKPAPYRVYANVGEHASATSVKHVNVTAQTISRMIWLDIVPNEYNSIRKVLI